MIRYVVKRLLLLIPVILCVSFIVYALFDMAPGTVIDAMITEGMTEADIQALREQFNLHRPMIYRYGVYLFNLMQGNMGVSQITGLDVFSSFMERLPNTLILSLGSLIIGASISIPLGIFAAKRSGKLADAATTTFTLVGISMPSFWTGILLLMLFSYTLNWLPAGGFRHGFASLILPSICGSLMMLASSARQTRSSMLDVLKTDYLRTARAKGVPENVVIRKHALGNALIPIVTVIGSALCFSLAGAAVIEQVFSWPGIGRLTVEAVAARDVTMALGSVIMTTTMYVLVLLTVDMIYAFVDPRIKAQYINMNKKKKKKPLTEQEQGNSLQVNTAVERVSDIIPTEEEAIAKAPALMEDLDDDYDDEPSAPIKKSPVMKTYVNNTDIRAKYKKRSRFGELFHRLKQSKSAVVGMILLSLIFIAFLASLFIDIDTVMAVDLPNRLASPSLNNLFGADHFGRDMFLRTVYGTRYSISIAFGAAGIAAFIGITLGALAGYFGGAAEEAIMRFSDILASIPGLLLGMVIMVVLGQSLPNLIFAVGVNSVPAFIRITRASILNVGNQEFVEASRAIGLPNRRIIFRHVLPNGLSPIIVTFTMNLGMSIIIASSLSFLGFGVPVGTPEWGLLIADNRMFARVAPHLMIFPGLFILLTVLSFNLLGDGLRDALDPKLKK
jgi:ABC-type dipeptide/oligopeptide/nickel transport system permease component